jgi:large subunit ribosomal protein L15
VKILATGKLTSPLVIKANKFSASALAAIEAAGGKAEVL